MRRFLSIVLVLVACRVFASPPGFRIPVLCYHSVTDRETGSFTIPTGINLPRKPVVITFDDNYPSIPINALPILKMYGFKATNFVYTLFMNPARWKWLAAFAAEGLSFGSHTCTHVDLTRRKPGETVQAYHKRIFPEMRDSRRVISTGMRMPIRYLAYPFGTSTRDVRYLARLAGYSAMFSALGGYVTEKSELDNIPRFTIFRKFNMEMFRLIVSGGWNRGLEEFIQNPDDFRIREYNFDFGK